MVILAVLAVQGLRVERRALLADAHEQAGRVAASMGRVMDREWAEAWEDEPITRLYDAAPMPGAYHRDQERLQAAIDARDLAALGDLCQKNAARRTRAGVPIAALAAWERYRLDASPENREMLGRIAIHQAPSVISAHLLDRAGIPGWRDAWKRAEGKRRLLMESALPLPEDGETAPLRRGDALLGWAAGSESGHRVLEVEEMKLRCQERVFLDPAPWMGYRMREGEAVLLESGNWAPEKWTMARHDGALETEVFLDDSEAFFAPYRRRRAWTMGVIALALGSSLGGLILTQRALRREHRLNAMKSQFVASVSHELRAPVASMRLMAEALASGKVATPTKTKAFHRLMANEGARLSSMVENVLDFARIEQGRKTYVLAGTDVEALVHEAADLLRPQADAREVDLKTTLTLLDFSPEIDAQAVQQAVINLIDNAIKFSPKGSNVSVSVEAGEMPGEWSVSVADQGPGIAAEDQTRIFERFVRLEDELRRETQGAGIGLSLVSHVMRGHGGTVTLKSALGEGSIFTLHFPSR